MKKLILLLTIPTFLFYSCEKENPTPSPNELIQGKWKIILMGSTGDLRPYDAPWIYEYYNDSLLREYDTVINAYTSHAKYTIDQEFLIRYYNYPEDTLIFTYKYEFYDKNSKLKLVHHDFITTYSTTVYERLY
jgi:hypothetical protein